MCVEVVTEICHEQRISGFHVSAMSNTVLHQSNCHFKTLQWCHMSVKTSLINGVCLALDEGNSPVTIGSPPPSHRENVDSDSMPWKNYDDMSTYHLLQRSLSPKYHSHDLAHHSELTNQYFMANMLATQILPHKIIGNLHTQLFQCIWHVYSKDDKSVLTGHYCK